MGAHPAKFIAAHVNRKMSWCGHLAFVLILATGGLMSFRRPLDSTGASPRLIPICALQGGGFQSPYTGQTVRTTGTVFADLDETAKRGFFIQIEGCDENPATSDGLFVYLGVRGQVVSPGDRVEVSGIVQEYYGLTELRAEPTGVSLLAPAQPLPAPVGLAPPFDNHQVPEYYERFEGMSVRLDDVQAAGPTDADGRSWVVLSALGIERVFQDDPQGTGEILCIDDSGNYKVAPEVKTGDRVSGLAGALDYTAGQYCLQLISSPAVYPASLTAAPPVAEEPAPGFSIGTFNLADLFDTLDDPDKEDTILSAAEYQRRLAKRAAAIHSALGEPAILAVQEVENQAVLAALLARPEIEGDYEIAWVEGPDERGIDVALLARTDRVRVLATQVRQGCTRLKDGLGPDGNRDVLNPQNILTCDTDDDGRLDGNRLFSRPPLIVHLQVCRQACFLSLDGKGDTDLWVIVNHFKSKVEDGDTVPYTQPRRVEEAAFTAGLASEILARPGASLVVLGDLNDFPVSLPLEAMKVQGLWDLWPSAARPYRYSFVYQGISQALDYIQVAVQPPLAWSGLQPVHINADYPAGFARVDGSLHRSSDHDPLLARFVWMDSLTYLPILNR